MRILGIDPGVSGGLAIIGPSPRQNIQTQKLQNLTIQETWKWVNFFAHQADVAYIEKVHASPPQRGKNRRSGTTSMFTFGDNFGQLKMALTANGVKWRLVTPQKWQAGHGLKGSSAETQTQKKNRHKDFAMKLFPSLKITHALADALLIAEYGRLAAPLEGLIE